MEEVIKIFKQIQNTSSTNDKKAIIEANKDNELFKKCLVFLLDSNIVTGISDKKLNKFVGMSGTELNSFEEVMKYLADFNSGASVLMRAAGSQKKNLMLLVHLQLLIQISNLVEILIYLLFQRNFHISSYMLLLLLLLTQLFIKSIVIFPRK